MSIRVLLPLLYAVTTLPLILLSIRLRHSDTDRFVLLTAIELTNTCLFSLFTTAWAFSDGRWISGVINTIWAVVNLVLAHIFWDVWNNRRKRKKSRAAGRVGVRLGRLVIVPEN